MVSALYSRPAFFSVFVILSACMPDSASNYLPSDLDVEVHAHRGGAALEPENTLQAFRVSVAEVGVDAIELDIHATSDRGLVINHDTDLNPGFCLAPGGKVITQPVSIPDTSFADLREYDCGTLVGLPPGTPIPSLDEVFSTVESLKPIDGAQPQYDLHLKWDGGSLDAQTFTSLILDVVQREGVEDRVHFMSDSTEVLQAARALDPDLTLYYLTDDIDDSEISFATALNVAAMAPQGALTDLSGVQKLHERGIKVIPWTVNDPSEWKSLMDIGVDAIITDNPQGLDELKKGNLTDQRIFGPSGD